MADLAALSGTVFMLRPFACPHAALFATDKTLSNTTSETLLLG